MTEVGWIALRQQVRKVGDMDVVHSEKREVRLDLRIDPERKERLKRAAAIRRQTLTDFVLGTAEREAEAVLREEQTIALSPEASAAFVDALMHPPEPNDALRDAWRRYRSFAGE